MLQLQQLQQSALYLLNVRVPRRLLLLTSYCFGTTSPVFPFVSLNLARQHHWYKKINFFFSKAYCRFNKCFILLQVKQNVALALTSIFLAALPSVLGFLPLWLTVCKPLIALLISMKKNLLIRNFFLESQVLLHEGGTLLVCLNSVRGLNDPSWSWKQDIAHLINKLSSRESTSSNNSLSSVETAHQVTCSSVCFYLSTHATSMKLCVCSLILSLRNINRI